MPQHYLNQKWKKGLTFGHLNPKENDAWLFCQAEVPASTQAADKLSLYC